jgi:hypothetical protein
MKTVIIYALPFDNWREFAGPVHRFIESFKAFPPGADYELWAMCCWGEPINELRWDFYGIKTKFLPHYQGCDCIAVHQATAQTIDEDFLVCCSTRTYFHRAGWLKRLVDARAQYGPGLYGAASSRETGHLHITNQLYALDAEDFRSYPWEIRGRDDAPSFEAGPRSITNHMAELHQPCMVTYWDEILPIERALGYTNGFRNGNQEQMIAWNRHTDLWRDSDEDGRKRLTEAMLRG